MKTIDEVGAALAKAGVFFLATVDGDKPRTRPISFKMMVDGQLYFGVGCHKAVYRQMQANPHVEVCACKGADWVRYSGTAVFDSSAALYKKACETLPLLARIYNKESGLVLGIFRLENASADFGNLMGVQQTVQIEN